MNYKSKLLSVFLSAGILLNSTSMAFAGQDDVATVSDKQCVKNEDPYERFLNYPKELANEGGKVFYVDGKEWRQGVEWSEKQKGDEWSPDIFWLYNGRTKTLYISGKNECALADSHYHEYNWLKFINKDEVEHLVIIGVKNIGDYAFREYTELKTVELSEGLVNIRSGAFLGCKKLTTVKIPKSLRVINAYAFADCDLTSIELPEGFKCVWRGAFANNKHLKTVKILELTIEKDERIWPVILDIIKTGVPRSPFDGCEALTSITVPKRCGSILQRWVIGYFDANHDKIESGKIKVEFTE